MKAGMETSSYVLGSGILGNPNIVPSCLFMFLSCLSAWLACRILEKGREGRDWQVLFFSILCVVGFLACFVTIHNGAKDKRRSEVGVEKVEFENHDYLLFKDKGVVHDPACECRKAFGKLR